MGKFIIPGTWLALDVLVGYGGLEGASVPFAALFLMGISPVSVAEGGDEFSRRADFVAGDGCRPRCDFRLCFSIKLTAQATRSTGVRFAACRNKSLS